MSQVIRFGIPSLDTLFAKPEAARHCGLYLPQVGADKTEDCSETITFCIAGIDGTGKSVLAMHLASAYLGDSFVIPEANGRPAVVYVTTDLSLERAKTVWDNFCLQAPGRRIHSPFPAESEPYQSFATDFHLHDYLPLNADDPYPFQPGQINLVDLAAASAGDDWGFINRLLAACQPLSKERRRNLLVIDAVEGLETYVGEKDQFGESRTRRSRIAQLLRAARGKCHVVFVVEEPEDGSKLPEDFVADVVLRLRHRGDRDYTRRTIEIEKARGQAHARGQHEFVIRGGAGTTTGDICAVNPDDPRVPALSIGTDGVAETPARVPQSYFYVFQSVHYLNREIMRHQLEYRPESERESQLAGFGIRYLDNMLTSAWRTPPKNDHSTKNPDVLRGEKSYGLPVDAPTALIGEDATYKSRLGRAFLSQCFAIPSDPKEVYDPGVAILLTTKDIERHELLSRFAFHLNWDERITQAKQCAHKLLDRIICRRLEVHHMSPSVLIHIVKRTVELAQRMICGDHEVLSDVRQRRANGHRIRLVIDNWTAMQRAYPEVRNDPLFLPFLLFYLRREGICSLIIATDGGGPRHAGTNGSPVATLRELTQHQIHTWHVPFFGTNRVAIAAVPPQGGEHLAIIRELRLTRLKESHHERMHEQRREVARHEAGTWQAEFLQRREHLIVDPRFELYRGLEEGNPSLVPFRTHLFAETEACLAYHTEMNELFSRLSTGQVGEHIVFSESASHYERLRDFSHLQRGARLDHTLVFQVDEFWAESDPGHLLDQEEYLFTKTVEYQDEGLPEESLFAVAQEDPFRVLQPSELDTQRQKSRHIDCPRLQYRYQFLDRDGTYLDYLKNKWHLNKVPFFWDFGFLLCHERAWHEAMAEDSNLKTVWRALIKPNGKLTVTWRDFFQACKAVAAHRSARQSSRVRPFDLSLIATESFSCLILEMWASELFKGGVHFERVRHSKPSDKQGLIKMLQHGDGPGALFRVFLLLGDVFSPEQVASDGLAFCSRSADPAAIAARHWYSTACAFSASEGKAEAWIPLRLPGSYSVRGDWFLAVAKGSLSPRIGERTIDLLNTRRGNIVRLQSGIGLPVRDTSESDAAELWTPLISARGSRQRMTFRELLRLGASENRGNAKTFFWLWRSQLDHYDRHARIWQRWLCDMLIKWFGNNGSDDALKKYDEFPLSATLRKPTFDRDYPYFANFADFCKKLADTLHRATPAPRR